jgi:uncharacterized protein YbjT (DUF2867 family)
MNKRALVFGATGLVGSELIELLLENEAYSEVVAVSRRPWTKEHPKLRVEMVDFDHLDREEGLFQTDEVFCCLGTTMKKAGSEAAFKRVDYEIPLQIGQMARKAGIRQYLIVTAMGADTKSFFFYNRVKGEIEKDLASLDFPQLVIVRPGLLLGDREENRWGESMAKVVMQTFSPILPLTYRPISGRTVARALIRLAGTENGHRVVESGELQKLGKD